MTGNATDVVAAAEAETIATALLALGEALSGTDGAGYLDGQRLLVGLTEFWLTAAVHAPRFAARFRARLLAARARGSGISVRELDDDQVAMLAAFRAAFALGEYDASSTE